MNIASLDKPRCNCGVFGIFANDNASLFTYYGLHSLQHRGQEAAGIVTSYKNPKGKSVFGHHKDMGLVYDVFTAPDLFEKILIGNSAIGHNRYSTTGSADSTKNIQPFMVNYRMGNLAIAHNGNLTNAKQLRKKLVNEGSLFQTTSDTEVILHLIAKSQKTTQIEQIKEALSFLEGSYSLVILTDDKLFGARDPYGFRPMCLGKINGSYIITSETCALDINSAEYIRDIEPGEIVSIEYDKSNQVVVNSYLPESKLEYKHCVFEYIYFSRPDSKVFGVNVDKLRRKLGKVLAQNHPVTDPDGDKVVVISVPDSSNTAALGYQNQLKKMGIESKYELGLIRSHYIGRTFITPSQKKREVGVKIKFNIVKGVLEGKTIVLVDDSIVRGTTSKQLIRLLREANPKSIHVRISSPTIISPCYYGMDFPSKEELIANKYDNDVEKIREYMEADSLEYLTNDELLDAMIDHEPSEFCTACFSGIYPVKVNMEITKDEYDD